MSIRQYLMCGGCGAVQGRSDARWSEPPVRGNYLATDASYLRLRLLVFSKLIKTRKQQTCFMAKDTIKTRRSISSRL